MTLIMGGATLLVLGFVWFVCRAADVRSPGLRAGVAQRRERVRRPERRRGEPPASDSAVWPRGRRSLPRQGAAPDARNGARNGERERRSCGHGHLGGVAAFTTR